MIYIGKAAHKGMYPGRHRAIVNRALWNKVHRFRRVLTLHAAEKGGKRTLITR